MPRSPAKIRGSAEGSRRLIETLALQHARLTRSLGVSHATDAPQVHASRVAARRLRSLLRTYEPLLDRPRARAVRLALSEHARHLAAVRDADVRRERLVALAECVPALHGRDRARLDAALAEAGERARAQLAARLQEPDAQAVAEGLRALEPIEGLVLDREASRRVLLRLAARPWKRVRVALGDFPQTLEEQHALRLMLKHCRYATEPLRDLAPRRAKRLLRRLRAAQDTLGEHRDCLLARQWVEASARALGRTGTRVLLGRLAEREARLLRRARAQTVRLRPAYRRWRAAARRQGRAS